MSESVRKPDDAGRAVAAYAKELGEVRAAHRVFKESILRALGVTDPWAITTENEARIVERIEDIRAVANAPSSSEAVTDEEKDAARWRFVRELLAVDSDDDENGPHVAWVMTRNEFDDALAIPFAWGLSVDQIVDAAIGIEALRTTPTGRVSSSEGEKK